MHRAVEEISDNIRSYTSEKSVARRSMGACVRRRVAARARAFAAIETRIVRVRVIGPTVSWVSSASAPGVFGSSRSRGGALVKVSFRLPSFGVAAAQGE